MDVLYGEIKNVRKSWKPAYELVQEAAQNRRPPRVIGARCSKHMLCGHARLLLEREHVVAQSCHNAVGRFAENSAGARWALSEEQEDQTAYYPGCGR